MNVKLRYFERQSVIQPRNNEGQLHNIINAQFDLHDSES